MSQTRLAPLSPAELTPPLTELLQQVQATMGFMPNDALIMARKPHLTEAFAQLVQAVNRPGELPDEIRRLAALAGSMQAECSYCTGHTRFSALRRGIAAEKVQALDNWRQSPVFSAQEKAAINLAQRASQVPNAVRDEDFAELKALFSEQAILELLAVMALFGFLNRWNSTLGTELEPACRL